MLISEAMKAFDLAFMFTNQDSKIIHFLLLVKARQVSRYSPLHNHYDFQAIALFNANQHENAMSRIQQLADACPNADILACRVVEVSVMLTIKPGFTS
jgi:hypothetical protein